MPPIESKARFGPGDHDAERVLLDLRCSMVVIQADELLLLHRVDNDEWILPGGRPRPGESLISCVRREVREETGLNVVPGRCLLVLEVAEPDADVRAVELVFAAGRLPTPESPLVGEPGRSPRWVPLSDLGELNVRPPIAGHLRGWAHAPGAGAPYLGNVWRPRPKSTAEEPHS